MGISVTLSQGHPPPHGCSNGDKCSQSHHQLWQSLVFISGSSPPYSWRLGEQSVSALKLVTRALIRVHPTPTPPPFIEITRFCVATPLLMHFTCRVPGQILIVLLPFAAFSQTSMGRRTVNFKPSSRFNVGHIWVPLFLLEVGISSRQILLVLVQLRAHALDHPSCFFSTSSRVLLWLSNGWRGGGVPPSWLGPSLGQTMVEKASLFIAERVPEPLQQTRRTARCHKDGWIIGGVITA